MKTNAEKKSGLKKLRCHLAGGAKIFDKTQKQFNHAYHTLYRVCQSPTVPCALVILARILCKKIHLKK